MNRYSALHVAARRGDHTILRMLLAADGAQVNLRAGDGSTALVFACEHGQADTVQLLLRAPGVDVNIPTASGR
jgi:ankyrin repeat protein